MGKEKKRGGKKGRKNKKGVRNKSNRRQKSEKMRGVKERAWDSHIILVAHREAQI